MTSIDQLALGAGGRVLRVIGDDELSQRLLEMGLTPGVDVRMSGAAPLGDPLEIELRGYRLSLRRGEAARVEIAATG